MKLPCVMFLTMMALLPSLCLADYLWFPNANHPVFPIPDDNDNNNNNNNDYSDVDMGMLTRSLCTNCNNEINADLGDFTDPLFDPWATTSWQGYDTTLPPDKKCVVKVDSFLTMLKDRLVYSLETMDLDQALVEGETITHYGSCGTCSDLYHLALYMENIAIEQDAFECAVPALKPLFFANNIDMSPQLIVADLTNIEQVQANFPELMQSLYTLNDLEHGGSATVVVPSTSALIIEACLFLRIGMWGGCAKTWAHNILYLTIRCGGVCLETESINADAESQGLDPPIPINELMPNPDYFATKHPFLTTDFCDPDTHCPNTINGGPTANPTDGENACYDEAYEHGSPYRLNSCFQCDECNNGPRFSLMAGRTRKNTGLVTTFARPPDLVVDDLDHIYCQEGINCPS